MPGPGATVKKVPRGSPSRWPRRSRVREADARVSEANEGPVLSLEVVRVDLRVLRFRRGDFVVGEDGVDRAGGFAGAAVDALVRVDVQHLLGAEVGFVLLGVDAVHRTHV